MVDSEPGALDVVARALAVIADRPAELLLADSSRAHLRRAAVSSTGGQAGCGVESPWQCPAVRRGQTMRFVVDDDLASCPRLRHRGTACSAVCAPVTVLGTPMGVLHVTGEAGNLPDRERITQLETLALQAGSRIGMLRAITSSQLQASTDPLTGAANRRSLEARLHHLADDHTPYALVLADLDHFKQINDTHGHTTGDRALRLFVDVLRNTVREQDMVVRYGGEEFVIVLPGSDRTGALEIIDRVRLGLTRALDGHEVPRFTASYGVADSSQADTPERLVHLADLAMLEAKQAGRDRVTVAADVNGSMGTALGENEHGNLRDDAGSAGEERARAPLS
jgi:diguanylate cyclase (GGDEF)-like protein